MKLGHLLIDEDLNELCYNLEITGISDDSRKIVKGDLFYARQGSQTEGSKYIELALELGAVCAYTSNGSLIVEGQEYKLNNSLDAQNLLSLFYKIDLVDWTCFGVTGTNGKSTMACLVSQILKVAKRENLLLGTLGNHVGDEVFTSDLTTPGLFEFYKWLAKAQEKNISTLCMEVSSHALDQNRVQGVEYDVVALTNLTQDHLDYHKSMEAYLEAKSLIISNHLKEDGVAWVWSEDNRLKTLQDSRIRFYGQNDAETKVKMISNDVKGIQLEITIDECVYNVDSSLIGDFNVDNIIGAVAIAHSLKIDNDSIYKALKTISVPGRLERINLPKGKAFVDYAHTPDALEKVLSTCKKLSNSKLVCLFGCGGDRDKGKRPLMAKIAESIADTIIITSDNPRTEAPTSIIDDICVGLVNPEKAYVIEDREKAICLAASLLEENDVLVVAGKGHEDYQIIGREKIFFDDRLILKEWAKQ